MLTDFSYQAVLKREIDGKEYLSHPTLSTLAQSSRDKYNEMASKAPSWAKSNTFVRVVKVVITELPEKVITES